MFGHSNSHGAFDVQVAHQLRGTARFVFAFSTNHHHVFTRCAAAFEDFLRSFKSSSTEAADALDSLDLNEHDEDDEYDFMDETEEDGAQRRGTRPTRSKAKYMNVLQDVADRKVDHIVIDLDDVEQVHKHARGRLPIQQRLTIDYTVREGAGRDAIAAQAGVIDREQRATLH